MGCGSAGQEEPVGIVVGRARVFVGRGRTRLVLHIDGAWGRKDDRWCEHLDALEWLATTDVSSGLMQTFAGPDHTVSTTDADLASTTLAKAIAEGSRSAVALIRGLRYDLERSLVGGLDHDQGLRAELAALIELRRIVSRARDFARAEVRTVMSSGTAERGAVYHAYRVWRDETLLMPPHRRLADLRRIPWAATLDAGVRQCEALEAQLADEVDAINGLLTAAATMSAARDAEAQGRLNAVAGAAAVGLGLPALILALYGIERSQDTGFADLLVLLVPVGVALGLAGLVYWGTGRGQPRRPAVIGLTLGAVVLLLLALAAWLQLR